nr:anaerobic C4-dicarboxylate transporter family protein [Pajaroellobacter abortibovis]
MVGARFKGISLWMISGLALLILTFVLEYCLTSFPIDVMLMIASVVTAAGALQYSMGNGLPHSSCEAFLTPLSACYHLCRYDGNLPTYILLMDWTHCLFCLSPTIFSPYFLSLWKWPINPE